jgi:hypothetical protein
VVLRRGTPPWRAVRVGDVLAEREEDVAVVQQFAVEDGRVLGLVLPGPFAVRSDDERLAVVVGEPAVCLDRDERLPGIGPGGVAGRLRRNRLDRRRGEGRPDEERDRPEKHEAEHGDAARPHT